MGNLSEYIPLCVSTASLAAIPTTLIPLNAVIKFVDSVSLASVSYQLRSGGTGTVVPLDYNASSNNVSWFQV